MKKVLSIGSALVLAVLLTGCQDKEARASIETQSKKIDELTNETFVLRSEIQTLKRQITENDDKISKIALYLRRKELQAAQQKAPARTR